MPPAEGEVTAFKLVNAAGALISRFGKDAEGRLITLGVPGGAVYRFAPHDCERVLGICDYTMTGPDGRETRYQRVTGREGGAWVYSLFEEREGSFVPVRIGTVSYDKNRLPLSETWTDLENAGTGSYRRIDVP